MRRINNNLRNLFLNNYSWFKLGSFSIFDQAIITGTNFILTIILARLFNERDYGSFSTIYSYLILLCTIHSVIIIEPMMVYGPSKYQKVINYYLISILLFNFIISLILIVIIYIISYILRNMFSLNYDAYIYMLLISEPFIIYFWILKRILYIHEKPMPQISFIGGIFYLLIMLFLIFGFYKYNILSLFNSFLIIGFSNFIIATFLLLKLEPKINIKSNYKIYKDIEKDHFNYGKWSLGTVFFDVDSRKYLL